MLKKLIIAYILIAFVAIQIVTSLDCYNCRTPSECINPSRVTCSNASANATIEILNNYYTNVLSINGSVSFKCAKTVQYHVSNRSEVIHVRGCVHRNIQVCNLQLRPEYNASLAKACADCDYNLCNGIGTFGSSIFTLVGSIFVLILAKHLV